MSTLTFTLTGGVNIEIIVTELDDGSLKFDLSVLDETGSIGDLNAIFFDLADDSLAANLTVTGDDVTGTKFKADGVTKIDNFTNINGEVANEYGKFDSGVQFGTSGMAQDDIRETSFILSHDDADLTIDMILGQDFAARLTSVGEEGGARGGSLKLGGTAPAETDVGPGPDLTANDDTMEVLATETFNTDGSTDLLDGSRLSVLENDILDGFWFENQVESVNGDASNVEQIVAGSNGGLLMIYQDGTVDFSANDEFETLDEDEVATTEFTYGIEGGDTATLTVYVTGLMDVPA